MGRPMFVDMNFLTFQPLAYLIELNSAVDGLEFMQRNINFFDSKGFFVIVLRDIKPDIFQENHQVILQRGTRSNMLRETDRNIIRFVRSPIMERLPNSVFLVLRHDTLVHIWGQVKITLMIFSHRSQTRPQDSFDRGKRLSASYLGTYHNGRFWAGQQYHNPSVFTVSYRPSQR